MEEHLTSIAVGLVGPAIPGVFAFLWKVNSKLSTLERDIAAHENRIRSNAAQLAKHFDKAFTIRRKVDDP